MNLKDSKSKKIIVAISIILLVYGISKFDIRKVSLNKLKLHRPKKLRKKIG